MKPRPLDCPSSRLIALVNRLDAFRKDCLSDVAETRRTDSSSGLASNCPLFPACFLPCLLVSFISRLLIFCAEVCSSAASLPLLQIDL